MTTIKLTIPELKRFMREYTELEIGKSHPVEASVWRSLKRSLVENKRLASATVTDKLLTTYEAGDFPCGHYYTNRAYNLSYFIEFIILNSPAETENDMITSACDGIATSTSTTAQTFTDALKGVSSLGVLATPADITYSNRTNGEYWTTYSTHTIPDAISSIHIDEFVTKNECAKRRAGIKKANEEKENNTMNLSFDFGKITGDTVRVSMYGIAVKAVDGRYVSYDSKNHSVMDVDIMNMPCGDFLYKMPVAIKDIAAGDVVIHNKVPMFVVEVHESTMKVVDIREGTEKEIYLTRSPFGFNFATKVISLMDFSGKASNENPFGGMLPFFMMKDGNIEDVLPILMFTSNGNMDITKNPMALLMLMKDETKMKDILPLLMMSGMNNG